MSMPSARNGEGTNDGSISSMKESSISGGRPSRDSVRPSPMRFLLLSLLFHLVYISSVFDIYFTSPVVHPQPRFSIADTFPSDDLAAAASAQDHVRSFPAPADRLVLMVGDGLRADTLFKQHPLADFPGWAQNDLLSAKGGVQRAFDEFEAEPFELGYPYQQALSKLKSDGLKVDPDQGTEDSAFAGPFLRSVAQHRGIWGLSHTRVPTESRPGHVAMIAGMYEDVSAVTKGWKLNPIAFDSLLNQSTHSYAFGSPDIVPMFAVGAASDRVDMLTYDEEAEDFTKDATALDLWVLDQVRELLHRASQDPSLKAKLQRKGTVFFLHLLGLDTTGHTYRPFSPEYIGNAVVVDALAREVEKLFDEFYGFDGKTAYVFTADHGMSAKGNHGDGHPDNTRTPLVAWGAGVRGPMSTAQSERDARLREAEGDGYFAGWQLDQVGRVDVDQADITPLMAALIGVPTPANSEGKLRVDLLALSDEHRARALLANALQVLEVYRVKHHGWQRRMIRYVPFAGLATSDGVGAGQSEIETEPGQSRIAAIQTLIQSSSFQAAIAQSEDLIALALAGSRYLQTYDWLLLCTIVTAGYLGSILYGLAFLLRAYVLPEEELARLRSPGGGGGGGVLSLGRLLIVPVMGILYAKFAREEAPATYYAYATLACFMWGRVVDERELYATALRIHRTAAAGQATSSAIGALIRGTLAVLTLELIVLGYLYRIAWFLGFLAIGLVWPALFVDADFKAKNEALLLVWGISCIVSGLFTISDVEKEESIPLLVLSGVLFFVTGWLVTAKPEWFFPSSRLDEATTKSEDDEDPERRVQEQFRERTRRTIRVQLVILVVTTFVTASSARSLQLKRGLPLPNQMVAWAALVLSFAVPFVYGFCSPVTVELAPRPSASQGKENGTQRSDATTTTKRVRQPATQRLAILVFAFAPVFILLSLRDEALFFGWYTLNLLVWSKMEGALYEERIDSTPTAAGDKRRLQLADLRISLFFLFFLHVGFFGTGNIASISSFYLSPVYRLIPTFHPFLMSLLLVLKLLLPFLLLNITFQTLCTTPPSRVRSADDLRLVGAAAFGGLGLVPSSLPLVFSAAILTDALALTFLFLVRTEGSWLQIGQGITHFVMANLLNVFMLVLAAGSGGLVGGW